MEDVVPNLCCYKSSLAGRGFNNFLMWVCDNDLMINKKRRNALESHILVDDYFGTLATVLDLLRQEPKIRTKEAATLEWLRDDLLYLQENYQVTKRKFKKRRIAL